MGAKAREQRFQKRASLGVSQNQDVLKTKKGALFNIAPIMVIKALDLTIVAMDKNNEPPAL